MSMVEPDPLAELIGDDNPGDGVFSPSSSPVPDTTSPRTPRRRRILRTADQPTPETAPKTRKTRAPRSEKRKSLAPAFAAVYSGAGSLAERSGDPRLVPAARAAQWVSPVAGDALDDLVAGTILDKLLQPVANKGDKVQRAFNVVGFPMLVYALTNGGEPAWRVLEPMARQMFYDNLSAMGPVIAAKRKRDAAVGKIVDQLVEEGMVGRMDDGSAPSPDDLFRMLFAQDLAPADGEETDA